jgi:ATP-binding cassette subfamily G (WHITE) protein 2 (PDR)
VSREKVSYNLKISYAANFLGLNVEQRKRLTIGVELAAKPELLLFLDEPTSGLDSQTSWAICDLMEKLTKNGQAVLCTV